MTTHKNNQRFLYLEDDALLAAVTCKALQRRGYEVWHCSSVAEVAALSGVNRFNYALLDLKLDDGTSLPLIESLIQLHADLKIVVLTGYASIATAVQAVKLGAVNYLSKPASVDEVLRAFASDQVPEAIMDVPEDPEMSLRRREWETIQSALVANGGNISATARQLKMHRRTLQRKLQKRPVSE